VRVLCRSSAHHSLLGLEQTPTRLAPSLKVSPAKSRGPSLGGTVGQFAARCETVTSGSVGDREMLHSGEAETGIG